MEPHSMGINFPTLSTTLLSKLKYEEDLNRNQYKQVTISFEDKIKINGFMDVIKVFPKSNGYYKIAESTHRVRALRNLSQGNDFEVPIAILDWKNGDDSEEVLSTIIEMNNTGKAWELFDYVTANSDAKHHRPNVLKTFKELKGNMKRLKKILTNAVVAGIYTGELRGHQQLRDRQKAKKFYVTSDRREYVDTMLDRLETLVIRRSKTFINTQFLRRLVYNLNRKANTSIAASKSSKEKRKSFDDWNNFFTSCIDCIDVVWSLNNFLPEGDSEFDRWYSNIK